MLKQIIAWSINNRFLVLALTIMVTIGGILLLMLF